MELKRRTLSEVSTAMPNPGTLDKNFGTNGIVTEDAAGGETGASDHGNSLAIDSRGTSDFQDDRIFVTGVSRNALGNWVMVIWCYESDGDPCGTSPGTAFGTNGIVTYEDATGVIDYQGNSLAIDSMGRTFVTGWSTANLNDMVIWCYESDGDPCGTSPALLAPTVL